MDTMYKKKDTVTEAVFRLSDMAIIGPGDNGWQEYQDWLATGNVALDPDPEYIPVPEHVSPLQIRKALRQQGLKSAIDQYVATLSEEAQEEWEYATQIERRHPLIVAAATLLNKTEAEVDDLFRLAASL